MTEYSRESRRNISARESQKAAEKLDDQPVESMDFLQGDPTPAEIGSAMPQPPGYPLPARKYGLPSWQTQVQNLIEDAMLTSTGKIASEQDLENVQNRLRYLFAYQKNLAADMRIRCDTTIRLLEERVKEYSSSNINEFIRKINRFTSSRIRTSEELAQAENYLTDLNQRRVNLANEYARAANLYISRLTERIKNYRENKI